MRMRFAPVLFGIVLASACSKSNAERDSQIGRTTYDGSEDFVPASRTVTPGADAGAMKAPPPSAPKPPEASTADEADADAGAKTPDVGFFPTPQPVVDKMLELARVTRSDIVYDLGCGDGRVVVTAAKRFGARAVGFDIDPVRVAEAYNNIQKHKVAKLVTIEQKDLFTVDLSPATVVTLYLLPKLNDQLLPQLEQLPSGARVVSHDYGITGIIPERHLEVRIRGDERIHELFLYTVPFKRAATKPEPKEPSLIVP